MHHFSGQVSDEGLVQMNREDVSARGRDWPVFVGMTLALLAAGILTESLTGIDARYAMAALGGVTFMVVGGLGRPARLLAAFRRESFFNRFAAEAAARFAVFLTGLVVLLPTLLLISTVGQGR